MKIKSDPVSVLTHFLNEKVCIDISKKKTNKRKTLLSTQTQSEFFSIMNGKLNWFHVEL